METRDQTKSIVHKEASARLWGELRGRFSSFNIGQIISLAAILLFVGICLALAPFNPSLLPFLKMIIVVLLILFVGVVIGGFVRNAFTKPEDEFSPVITKFMHQHRAIEIRGLPSSAVTEQFIGGVSALVFIENPPPEGVIEGDVTDDKAIRLLSDVEKQQLREKERQEIEQHKKKVQQALLDVSKGGSATAKPALPQGTSEANPV